MSAPMYEFVKYDVMLSQLFVLIVILFCLSVMRERERERDLVSSDCDSAPCAFSYFPIYKVNCNGVSYRYREGIEWSRQTYLNIL